MRIHPTAILPPAFAAPSDLEVGPYAIIEAGVSIGAGVCIGPFCHLYAGTTLEDGVRLHDGVIVGNEPQDMKYRGEETGVRIGAGACLREYVTVNRGTAASGMTVVGPRSLIMAYSHVAHDCEIGDGVIIANGVHMGGHVRIGAASVISGMTGIHQHVRIGPGAFVGGGLRVDKDVLPFSKAMGEPLRYAGLNEIGLGKLGFDAAAGAALKARYRVLFAAAIPSAADGGAAHASGPAHEVTRELPQGLRTLLDDFFAARKRPLLTRAAA